MRSVVRSLVFVILAVVPPSIAAAGTCWNGGQSGTAPWSVRSAGNPRVDSCEYDDVNFCVNAVAAAQDTVLIQAGTCTWRQRLEVTRAVKIIGAGMGRTIINNAYAPSLNGPSLDPVKHLISIVPASPADNPFIRISSMTFNFGDSSFGIYYGNPSTIHDCTNVRLDHLRLSAADNVFQRWGLAHGVMDNCIIAGRMGSGGSDILWSTNAYEYGTKSNFYIEDCDMEPYASTIGMYNACDGALRYAYRFNSIVVPTGTQTSPLWDQHGNQYGVQPSCFGAEIYGNRISTDGNPWTTLIFDQRGGKSLFFGNIMTWASGGGVWTRVREEHRDSDGSGPAFNAISGQPQHASDSYYWWNYGNGRPVPLVLTDELGIGIPAEDVHVWVEEQGFGGTSGIGAGSLASRPATCVPGVAYWATEQASPSAAADTIGSRPTSPLRGVLYRCTAANVWSEYYRPYEYPHPLRKTDAGAAVNLHLR